MRAPTINPASTMPKVMRFAILCMPFNIIFASGTFTFTSSSELVTVSSIRLSREGSSDREFLHLDQLAKNASLREILAQAPGHQSGDITGGWRRWQSNSGLSMRPISSSCSMVFPINTELAWGNESVLLGDACSIRGGRGRH